MKRANLNKLVDAFVGEMGKALSQHALSLVNKGAVVKLMTSGPVLCALAEQPLLQGTVGYEDSEGVAHIDGIEGVFDIDGQSISFLVHENMEATDGPGDTEQGAGEELPAEGEGGDKVGGDGHQTEAREGA